MSAISVDGLTVRAAVIVGLAVVALLLAGWRKPARAEPRSPRGRRHRSSQGPIVVDVEHGPAPLYRRPGLLRRLVAAIGSGGIAVVVGVMVAVIVSFATAAAVVRLTDLLER